MFIIKPIHIKDYQNIYSNRKLINIIIKENSLNDLIYFGPIFVILLVVILNSSITKYL